MQILVLKESHPQEHRVSLVPENVKKLLPLGAQIEIEPGLGETINVPDEAYTEAGATLATDLSSAKSRAEILLRLRPPQLHEVSELPRGLIHISYLDPFKETELIKALAAQGVTALSMEMIPRTTLAQKMDALSSQANLAGYAAVIYAAQKLNRIFPMMMTPSGTISPAKVFIIGAGVAGLQAIATARRLGARVEAFDTRPVVEEQVESLGAKFIKIDLGETGQTAQGYAKQLTEEQLEKQRAALARHCSAADIVITTAQVFGRPAPRILTKNMLQGMRPGSVVIDLAVESGGNVEGSQPDTDVNQNGVQIYGLGNLPSQVAFNASTMYSNNLTHLLVHFWDKETKKFPIDLQQEILRATVITHQGEIVHETIKNLIQA